jgi:hypothetical protein
VPVHAPPRPNARCGTRRTRRGSAVLDRPKPVHDGPDQGPHHCEFGVELCSRQNRSSTVDSGILVPQQGITPNSTPSASGSGRSTGKARGHSANALWKCRSSLASNEPVRGPRSRRSARRVRRSAVAPARRSLRRTLPAASTVTPIGSRRACLCRSNRVSRTAPSPFQVDSASGSPTASRPATLTSATQKWRTSPGGVAM